MKLNKPIVLLGILVCAAVASHAQVLQLWGEKLPGFRKTVALGVMPDELFGLKITETGPRVDDADARMQSYIAKITNLPVTGLVWSDKANERRVLMGDLILRPGQAIPKYVFGEKEKEIYVLREVSEDKLLFAVQTQEDDADAANSFTFTVPFGLKDPVRNESSFGTGSKDAKK